MSLKSVNIVQGISKLVKNSWEKAQLFSSYFPALEKPQAFLQKAGGFFKKLKVSKAQGKGLEQGDPILSRMQALPMGGELHPIAQA